MKIRDKEVNLISLRNFNIKKDYVRYFYDFDIVAFEKRLRRGKENFWDKLGEKRALHIFHAAARRVPAYKDFLKRLGVHHKKIKTIKDFAKIPLTDKENYVQRYPLKMRCWDGKLTDINIIAMSSGISGQATFWPRAGFQEFEAAVIHELIYRFIFEVDKYNTLLIIGFPMGVYISGIATLIPSILVTMKGYQITIVSAGNSKNEILKIVKNLQKEYEQIILVGHPLFIKDVIETGAESGIRWSKRRLRMMFCSEEFSEKWRRYIIAKSGFGFNPKNVISTYGSSEMLLMAHETPLSIWVRNLMEKDKEFRSELIGPKSVPNFFQYNPLMRYIESVGDELIFTSGSGIPLIRFNLHDRGEVLPFRKVEDSLKKGGVVQFDTKPVWRIPFVALWGRSNYKIIFYAANIYPEHIRLSLNSSSFFPKLTGKFAIRKGYFKNMDEFLEVNIELKKGVKPDPRLAKLLQSQIIKGLQRLNMEYLFLCNHLDKDLRPRMKLWPYQHERYFKAGLKPRYIVED